MSGGGLLLADLAGVDRAIVMGEPERSAMNMPRWKYRLGLLALSALTGCASVPQGQEARNGALIGETAGRPAAIPKEAPPSDPDENPPVAAELYIEPTEQASPGFAVAGSGAVTPIVLPGPAGVEPSMELPLRSSETPAVHDPWERFNRRMHRFNAVVDRSVARPVAKAYVKALPGPVRSKVSNFFDNLGQPATVVNALLQGRFKHSVEALGRFAVNSTVGLAGLFDPATRLKMRKWEEDFGQTLATWGWKRSRYIELPFLGPSTLRDALGLVGDAPLQPLARVETDKVRIGLEALNLVDMRARLVPFDSLRDQADDEYLLVRDLWTQRRTYQIRQEEDDGASLPDYLKE